MSDEGGRVTVTSRRACRVARLEGVVRSYAWGSLTTLARIQGRPSPTSVPEAELWFGAHPTAPAKIVANGDRWPLDAVIAEAPLANLGPAAVGRFGPRLPFLLKLLAIERPLSLQAHPSAAQATAGYRDEQTRGVPVDDPTRTYRDAWPKPELLCALSQVDALAGFRRPDATRALLIDLAVPELGWLVEDLGARHDAALTGAVERLLRWPEDQRASLVASVVERAAPVAATGGAHALACSWLGELGAQYPQDPGVVVAALLELVRLQPGDALHLPSGSLHAYLRGTAVEVMAASDNVLRGGLTEKYVDVDGLLHVLDPAPSPTLRVAPVEIRGGRAYPTPAEHFALERLVPGPEGIDLERRGPEILLAVGGDARVVADGASLAVVAGEAAFVPAGTGAVRLHGEGPVFRAMVGAF
jgi:mannose-6-phosphate isomerase